MSVKKSEMDATVAGATTWSLSWQAIPGRDFLAHRELVAKIRDCLIRAHRQPGKVIFYFLLMPSEIHAISGLAEAEPIDGIARSFSHVLSRWVREAQNMPGPVFARPCHVEPIASDDALRNEVRMLAWRPVRRGLCRTATHYSHSALRIALGSRPAEGFDAAPLRAVFGETKAAARVAIRNSVRVPPNDEEWRVWELARGLQRPIARVGAQPDKVLSRSVDSVTATLIAAGGSFRIEDALRLLEEWVIVKIGSRDSDLHSGSSIPVAHGRALVACLAVKHRLCAAVDVARHFGRAKSTLSEQMRECRKRPADRLILATPLERILEEAAALRASKGARSNT